MPQDTSQDHHGGCLCGAVRYRVAGPLRPVVACHCGQCRRTSGHHVAATQAHRADLTIEGDGAITWFQASETARRAFCKICGSHLFWDPVGGDKVSIFAGSLDQPSGLELAEHIFVADKGDYYEIADGLPQRAQGRTQVPIPDRADA
ncbi:MAG: GFA family protein [Pseudomonadota bacterium]